MTRPAYVGRSVAAWGAGLGVVVTIVGAAAVAWYAAGGTSLAGFDLVTRLRRLGEPAYAAALGWLLAAPVVLLVAAVALRRGPWAWVVAVAVHLMVLVGLATRFRALVPGIGWVALGVVVLMGLASVVAATASRPEA